MATYSTCLGDGDGGCARSWSLRQFLDGIEPARQEEVSAKG
jgi:hypothetical protein